MKVCILTTSFPAYEGHYQSPFIFKLAEGLTKEGLDIDVVCPFYKASKARDETISEVKVHRYGRAYEALTGGGGLPHNLKKSWLARLELIPYLLSFTFKALKYCRKADVIHAQWILSGLIGVIAKKLYKKKLILSTRGVAVEMASKNKLMRKVFKFILKNCDHVTPNNLHHTDYLVRLGVPRDKITTVLNGVDTTLFKPREDAKKKLGIDEKIVLFVGWLIERKGVEYLIDAFKPIQNAGLYIIGEGELREKINGNALILNPMTADKIAVWMSAADIFVLPSLKEGRPNVIYEAMLSGTAVIATDIGGSNEMVKHNETGILVPPKDSAALAVSIKELLLNDKLRAELSEKARKEILHGKMSWSDCARRFIEIYKK